MSVPVLVPDGTTWNSSTASREWTTHGDSVYVSTVALVSRTVVRGKRKTSHQGKRTF